MHRRERGSGVGIAVSQASVRPRTISRKTDTGYTISVASKALQLAPVLYLPQALNAILLLPILVFIVGITRDRALMGEHASGRVGTALAVMAIVLLALCVGALGVLSVL